MPQSIFLSYVYEDKPYRNRIERWAADGKLGHNRVTIAESEDLRHLGDSAIRKHLQPKIRGAAAIICLVGRDTHNHDWVKYELDVATSLNKRIVLVQVPDTAGAAPFGYRNMGIHLFDPSTIRKVL